MRPKQAGTAWESEIVARAQALGLYAERIPEGGMRDLGDVRISNEERIGESPDVVAVAWKRLLPHPGNSRRSPDGERDMVVLTLDDFLSLVSAARANAVVEAKAAQQINVSRVLAKARKKAGVA